MGILSQNDTICVVKIFAAESRFPAPELSKKYIFCQTNPKLFNVYR
jgi:hypothetical protein